MQYGIDCCSLTASDFVGLGFHMSVNVPLLGSEKIALNLVLLIQDYTLILCPLFMTSVIGPILF